MNDTSQRPEAVEKSCPHCGRAVTDARRKYCAGCRDSVGQAVRETFYTPPAAVRPSCRTCGETVEAYWRVCSSCSNPLVKRRRVAGRVRRARAG